MCSSQTLESGVKIILVITMVYCKVESIVHDILPQHEALLKVAEVMRTYIELSG